MGMCQAVREWGLATRCFAVDTWKGDAHTGPYDESVYQKLWEYNQFCYQDFSTLLRCTFDQALSSFPDGYVDLIHIDGYHTYEAVHHDFEAWLPKLAPGGVIMLHDIHMHRNDFGVYRLWEELLTRFPHTLEVPGKMGLGLIQLPYTEPDRPSIFPPPGSYMAHLLVHWLHQLGEQELQRQAQILEHKQALDQPPPTVVEPPQPQSLAARLLPAHTRTGHLARTLYRRLRNLPPPPQILPPPEPLPVRPEPPAPPHSHPALYHFYHVYADGHWRPILLEHLATLKKSGLLERLDTLRIGCVGHPENRRRVSSWLEALRVPFELVAQADTGYEQVTLDSLYQFSLTNNHGWVLYAHTKGAHDNRVIKHRWRRSMAHFTVTLWPQTIAHLDTCDAVGCHWLSAEDNPLQVKTTYPFFGGNFWWARLDYLSRLGPPATNSRHEAEAWVGQDPQIRPFDLRPGWPERGLFVPVEPFNGDEAP